MDLDNLHYYYVEMSRGYMKISAWTLKVSDIYIISENAAAKV